MCRLDRILINAAYYINFLRSLQASLPFLLQAGLPEAFVYVKS